MHPDRCCRAALLALLRVSLPMISPKPLSLIPAGPLPLAALKDDPSNTADTAAGAGSTNAVELLILHR
jgi:hypothetical protein